MRIPAVTVTVLALLLTACSTGAADREGESSAVGAAAPAAGGRIAQGDVASLATAGQASGVSAGVTVTGAGQATGAPDVVRVTVGVEVRRGAVQEALDAANAATERVIGALDAAGVAAQDRQTRDFSIQPEYGAQRPDQNPSITGYVVSNLIEATVRDVDRVGEVLSAVAEAGGDDTRVQGVRFDLESDGEQVAAARRAAFADARATAEQYAQLAGASLGALVGIEDVSVSSPRPAERFAAEAAAADAAVPIEPGEQTVTVRVVVRWALE